VVASGVVLSAGAIDCGSRGILSFGAHEAAKKPRPFHLNFVVNASTDAAVQGEV
jgi:hypothetical protein